jgi:hypothetical protein
MVYYDLSLFFNRMILIVEDAPKASANTEILERHSVPVLDAAFL